MNNNLAEDCKQDLCKHLNLEILIVMQDRLLKTH